MKPIILNRIDDKAIIEVVGLQAEELEYFNLNMLATAEKITGRIEGASAEA